MAMNNYAHQDWNMITLNRIFTKDEAMNKAKREGTTVSIKKEDERQIISKTRKIENETENFNIQKSGLTLGREIQQGRTAKKMTQKNLATMLNEKPNVIQQYESGQAIPNPQILNKIQKALGVKLSRPKRQS